MYILLAYFKFLLHSTNQHAIHSPFVFDLVTKCFYDKKYYNQYPILKEYRNTLLNDSRIIEVTDYGSGSRVFKDNKRKVRAIAQNAGISSYRAKLLFRLIQYFAPQNILEIGTSLGLATVSMALANQQSKITTLEGCPNTLAVAQSRFSQFNLTNIEAVETEFGKYLDDLDKDQVFDMIYFDGNHSKEATLNYFHQLLPTINNNSVWVFDDIHWSTDMEQAWQLIKQHPLVTVTIDTFYWGLVFFRTEQAKEHFVVRV
ncbi:MAG: class I SAM-dependent methyltransferase [Bacteroidota bacterium]|nr:class I SAM-dependent methyltransferase [Bacteroidota bacterium]